MEAWEFEGDWYIQFPDSLSLCMNTKEAVEYLRGLEAVAGAARVLCDGLSGERNRLDDRWCALLDAFDALNKEESDA